MTTSPEFQESIISSICTSLEDCVIATKSKRCVAYFFLNSLSPMSLGRNSQDHESIVILDHTVSWSSERILKATD